MKRFDTLNDDEQRNELLKGIYNQLATMNKWLEIIAVSYAKLSAPDVEIIREHTDGADEIIEQIFPCNDSRIGYRPERGLYIATWDNNRRTDWPLGSDTDYPRTEAFDEKIGCFANPDI